MELNYVIEFLKECKEIEASNKFLKNNLEVFVDEPNSILPFLDLLLYDCGKANSGYLSLIFKDIRPGSQANVNKILNICMNYIFNYKNLIPIFENLCGNNGSFIYQIDQSYSNIVGIIMKNKDLKSHFIFVNAGSYLLVFKKWKY